MSNTSSPAARFYVVTLSADEVDSVEAQLGRALGAKLAPAPRKAATPRAGRTARPTSLPWRAHGPAPERYQETTPALEAWLAKRHDPAFTPRPIATPPLGKVAKLSDKMRAEHERAWAAYAVTGKADGNAYPVTEYVAAFSRHVATLDALGARA